MYTGDLIRPQCQPCEADDTAPILQIGKQTLKIEQGIQDYTSTNW